MLHLYVCLISPGLSVPHFESCSDVIYDQVNKSGPNDKTYGISLSAVKLTFVEAVVSSK